MSKTAHQLHALKQHLQPGLSDFSSEDLATLAMYFCVSPRKVRIHSKSRSVMIADHDDPVRISMARWLTMTVQWQKKRMGKLTFENGAKKPNGTYDYRPIVRIAFKEGGPKYRMVLHKWIMASMYPTLKRRAFFIDGDRKNMIEANLMPKPYSSFFPGMEDVSTIHPDIKHAWVVSLADTGENFYGHDEVEMYRELAEKGAVLEHVSSRINVTGTKVVDTRVEWQKMKMRAQTLDALHDTDRGVRGWFSKPGRRENRLIGVE